MRDVPIEAIDKYEEFHRHAPKKMGAFSRSFRIPASVRRAGSGRWVTYQSDKVDPETLRRPSKPVDYIHQHDAGVNVYLPGKGVTVPREFVEVDALVKLGTFLGFCYVERGKELEVAGVRPMPELYCNPKGTCLYVIQSKREVLAMIWGGALGVFSRGIDG